MPEEEFSALDMVKLAACVAIAAAEEKGSEYGLGFRDGLTTAVQLFEEAKRGEQAARARDVDEAWAIEIARNVSGDEEPDELTLDRLLAADPDAWESTFVVASVPRVPIEGGRMPKGIATSPEQVEMLAKAVSPPAASTRSPASTYRTTAHDRRSARQVRQMLKGKASD